MNARIGDEVIIKNDEGIFAGILERYYHDGGVTVKLARCYKISGGSIESLGSEYFDYCEKVVLAKKDFLNEVKRIAAWQE